MHDVSYPPPSLHDVSVPPCRAVAFTGEAFEAVLYALHYLGPLVQVGVRVRVCVGVSVSVGVTVSVCVSVCA